ncbi:MAG TPA: SPFH domain-containing protein [bacterium]|nr:SPFH domain-containing protein [bacterium]
MFVFNILAMLASTALFVVCAIALDGEGLTAMSVAGAAVGLAYLCLVGPMLFAGIKVLRPNEALVFTLFGKYHGCLREAGIYFINPFAMAVQPSSTVDLATGSTTDKNIASGRSAGSARGKSLSRTISLKAMTLNNDKQKINDALGNPIVIGIVVIWRVVNPTKAVFNVDNYAEYLSIQCDSALRNIVRLYPYDLPDEEGETSLRGSSQEVAQRLKEEIQQKAVVAGIEIIEARITHLSYAPEIAAAMLQRQQASAIIAARQMIVEGAVGMVEMALAKLSANNIVELDEERKASMVSNLLVVLCSNKDAQPVVNSGSIY